MTVRTPVLTVLTRFALPLAFAGAVVAVPASAQAATTWHTLDSMHGAKAQVCKEPAFGGWRVKVRTDNRGGSHWHHTSLGNHSGRKWVDTRAAAGGISRTKSLLTNTGLNIGMGDAQGDRGGWLPIGRVGRC